MRISSGHTRSAGHGNVLDFGRFARGEGDLYGLGGLVDGHGGGDGRCVPMCVLERGKVLVDVLYTGPGRWRDGILDLAA